MSIPPTQAPAASPNEEHTKQSRHRARKRRKYNHAKESIYLAPEVEPYSQAIKPESSQPGPSRGYIPNNENGELIDASEATALKSPSKEKGKGKNKEQQRRGKDKNPLYQAAALKAWETKRQRQRERFEALEASNSLLSLGWGSHLPINYRDGVSRSGSGSDRDLSMPALDPLLDLDWSEVPDVPNDDLLQPLQSYSSRYYTANNLLLEPYKRIRHQPSTRRSLSRTNTPRREIEEIPDESGSEYGSNQAAGVGDNGQEKGSANGDGNDPESEVEMFGPRKRGGQRGKRKLKDMYLALDGSALLTLGVLIQETIVSRLQAEGYVPAGSLEAESEEEEEIRNAFEVSDDESELELESEEG